MKAAILIGDSIRMGYEGFVRDALAGTADVWAPEENGGTSRNVLAHLDEWVLSRNKEFDRLEADVIAYNEAAAEVCERLGVAVHDLYGVVMAAGRDGLLSPDGVHFKEEGYQVLGHAVARAIRDHL